MVEHRVEVMSAEARFLVLLTPAGFEAFTDTCGHPAMSLTLPPPTMPQRDSAVLADAVRRAASTSIPDLTRRSTQ